MIQQRETEEVVLLEELHVSRPATSIRMDEIVDENIGSSPAAEPKGRDRTGDGRDFDLSNPKDRAMAEDIFQALNSPVLNPVIQNTSPEQMKDLGVLLSMPFQVN
jgi:hypothetical protein